MGKSSKAPKAPDPQATAAAEAQFNRQDEYRPGGGGVRYGFTNAQGQFQQGVAPKGMQSAVQALESPTEAQIRTGLESQASRTIGGLGAAPRAPTAADFRGTPAPAMPNDRGLPGPARFDESAMPGVPNAPNRTGGPVAAPSFSGLPAFMGAPQRSGQAVQAPSFSGLPAFVGAPNRAGNPASARFDRGALDQTALPSSNPNDIPEIERALFGRSLSLMQPEIDRGRTRMQNDLQARGIPVGSEAWNEAVGAMERGTNESMDRLAQSAILAGGQEQSRRFGLDAAARDMNFNQLAGMFGMDQSARAVARGEQDQDYALAADARARARGEGVEDYTLRQDARATQRREQDQDYSLAADARARARGEEVEGYTLRQDARATARGEQDQDYALRRDASDAAWNRGLQTHDIRAGERATALGEQDRTFNLQNAVRSQALNEGLDFYNLQRGQRDASLNELAAMMGGAYNPTGPAARIGGGAPINYGSMVQQQYQNQLQANQARQQQTMGTVGGLANLGMAGYMLLSSRTLKERLGGIEPAEALQALLALSVERWRYRPEVADALYDDAEHVGPYADDWHAATGLGSGESISAIDLLGYLVASVQALAGEVRRIAPNGALFREVSHDCVA